MTLQVLIAAVNQDPNELIRSMELSSDAIIINQGKRFEYEELYKEHKIIKVFHMSEFGVGLSRNSALMRSDHDICLFSDQDIVFHPGYEDAILKEFEQNKKADMIIFNIEVAQERKTYYNTNRKRVTYFKSGRYGAVGFAIKRKCLVEKNITFSLLFGGGAKYSNGEDSLFLMECLKKGMKVYTSPVEIGREEAGESSWFSGYNEKFFFDRGVLYRFLYGPLASVFAIRFLLKTRSKMDSNISFKKAVSIIYRGIFSRLD